MSFIKHDFIVGPVLDEPGISDVEGGQWARRAIQCRWCGQRHRVWIGVDVTNIPDWCPVGKKRRLVAKWFRQ